MCGVTFHLFFVLARQYRLNRRKDPFYPASTGAISQEATSIVERFNVDSRNSTWKKLNLPCAKSIS